MNPTPRFAFVLFAFCAAYAQLPTGFVYTLYDVPGATTTTITGINDRGDVVGNYYLPDGIAHGFLRTVNSPQVITVDAPDHNSVSSLSINSRGDIAFASTNTNGLGSLTSTTVVWLRTADGQYRNLASLTSGQGFVTGINDQSQVIGFVFTKGPFVPFLLNSDGTVPAVKLNHFEYFGLNNADQVMWVLNDQTTNGGATLIVENPDGSTATGRLQVPYNVGKTGISNNGLAAGTYQGTNAFHGFLGDLATHLYVPVDVPGHEGHTTVNGVNDFGVVVGAADDTPGSHGFIATPVATTPQITPSAVGSAASYFNSAVSPGELVVLFGAGLGPPALTSTTVDASGFAATNVLTTRVLFDGIAAPLIYTWESQVAAVVPYEVTGSTTSIQVEYQGKITAPFQMPVMAATPAIFTIDNSGRGPGVILNQDNSVNTAVTPANRGDIVYFYATGMGQTAPPGINGKLTVLNPAIIKDQPLPVSVTIGGKTATVLYNGPAPGMIAGVSQINVMVPADAPSGATVPIMLQAGSASSRLGVTIAVK